jgi:hypothetical protein
MPRSFTVEVAESSFYEVEVFHRGGVTYSHEDMVAQDRNVILALQWESATNPLWTSNPLPDSHGKCGTVTTAGPV